MFYLYAEFTPTGLADGQQAVLSLMGQAQLQFLNCLAINLDFRFVIFLLSWI